MSLRHGKRRFTTAYASLAEASTKILSNNSRYIIKKIKNERR
jgi:hypothetical protein